MRVPIKFRPFFTFEGKTKKTKKHRFRVWTLDDGIFKINILKLLFLGGGGGGGSLLEQNPRNQKSQQTYNTTCQTKQGVWWND